MRGPGELQYEYIPELHTEKFWCTLQHFEYRVSCTCRGRQCELSVNKGGNTGIYKLSSFCNRKDGGFLSLWGLPCKSFAEYLLCFLEQSGGAIALNKIENIYVFYCSVCAALSL